MRVPSPGRVVSQTRVCDPEPQFTPFSLFRCGSQKYSAVRTSWRKNVPRQAFLPIRRLPFLPVHLLFLAPLLVGVAGELSTSREIKGYVAAFQEFL